MRPRLLAFDLDGTLMNSKNELTLRTQEALRKAHAAGVLIVPATGRLYASMPKPLLEMPFIRYAITLNGAQVYDVQADKAVSRAEIPLATALQVLEYLDQYPVFYDCYAGSQGWVTRYMRDHATDYIVGAHPLHMVRDFRTPVDELKAFLRQRGESVQKLQMFTKDDALRERVMADLAVRFPTLSISSSLSCNIEINDRRANKGEALAKLADYLGLPLADVMALGDGRNDLSLLQTAGLGVAMANAHPDVLAVSDAQTASCDEDGAALAIERWCLADEA